MKSFLMPLGLVILLFTSCYKKSGNVVEDGRLKARFEIKGICSNYTFSLIQGKMDPSLIEKEWTDPQTGKTYSNAFGVLSLQNFPHDLKEGDEFYFDFGTPPAEPVGTCAAWYPTPKKKLHITFIR